jgi:nickel-dependent lactate racemase
MEKYPRFEATTEVSVTIPFGPEEIHFQVPRRNILGISSSLEAVAVSDLSQEINTAIRRPIGVDLVSIVSRASKVTLLCDDYTRPTPSHQILPILLDELNRLGVRDESITIFVAKGTHRKMTEQEMRDKYGNVLNRIEILHNDAEDESEYRDLGFSSRGVPILVHKAVADADVRLGVGCVEAHPYAGFGGGPKIIIGALAKKSIHANHSCLAMSSHSWVGITEGNPCWMDLAEISKRAKLNAVLNVILASNMQIARAFFGEPVATQYEAIRTFKEIYGAPFPERADIVIASANPKYFYFDLAIVAILHSANIVKRGGTRIIAGYCNEGLGPEEIAQLYSDSLKRDWPSPEKYRQEIEEDRYPDLTNAPAIYKFLKLHEESDLIFISKGLSNDALTDLRLISATSIQDALDKTLEKYGGVAKVAVLPLGGMSYPYVGQEDTC